MPIPSGTARISLIGHQGSGEIFDTSFWIAGTGVPGSNADANTFASQVATQLAGPTLTALVQLLQTDSGYDEVRVYSYPTGGPSASAIGSAPISGGAGIASANLPLQMCMCATLRTGLAGRSHRGRMYIPADGLVLTTGHLMDTASCLQVAQGLAGFFGGVNGLGSTNDVSVVSQTHGFTAIVTSVTVDQRPDIQRRRANRQPTGARQTAFV